MDPTTLSQMISEYAAHLQAEKRLGAPTCERYVSAAQGFMALCRQSPQALFLRPDWALEQIDRRVVEAYLNSQRALHRWQPSTQAHAVTALKRFFTFLLQRGRLQRNPCEGLRPALKERPPNPPQGGEDAVLRLFQPRPNFAGRAGSPPKSESLESARLVALLELLYGGGLKPGQAYRITGAKVLARRGAVRLQLPGQELELLLGQPGAKRVQRYLDLRAQVQAWMQRSAPAEPKRKARRKAALPFWVDGLGQRCTPPRLAHQIKKALEDQGLPGGPGSLRHLAARHFRERGGDLRSLQQLLGAKRLGRLDRYRPAPDFKRLLEQFRKAHPREGDQPVRK